MTKKGARSVRSRERTPYPVTRKPTKYSLPTPVTPKSNGSFSKKPIAQGCNRLRQTNYSVWDADHQDDTVSFGEYSDEILEYLYDLELKRLPNKNDISCLQPWFHSKVRKGAVSMMYLMAVTYDISTSAVLLGINILERFLCHTAIREKDYKSYALASLLMGCKLTDVRFPGAASFSETARGLKHNAGVKVSGDKIIGYEREIMETLDYEITFADPLDFLKMFNSDVEDKQILVCSRYLIELMSWDHKFVQTRPSVMAATASYVARAIYSQGECWNSRMERLSGGLAKQHLKRHVQCLVSVLNSASGCTVFSKYKVFEPCGVSVKAQEWVLDLKVQGLDPMNL